MKLADVMRRYPETIRLCGSAFYRQLHYQCVIVPGHMLKRGRDGVGSGAAFEYTAADLRLVALRRLYRAAIGQSSSGLPSSVNAALARAMFDDETMTVEVVLERATVTLSVPPTIWAEIHPGRDEDEDMDQWPTGYPSTTWR